MLEVAEALLSTAKRLGELVRLTGLRHHHLIELSIWLLAILERTVQRARSLVETAYR